MQFGTFQTLNGDNSHARYKVISYASDAVLQDKLIRVDAGIPDSLIVGDLVDSNGNLATSVDVIEYVVVEPVLAGKKAFVVADPHHVILAKAGIELRNLDETAVLIALANKGFTFADYGTLALRTT